MVMSELNADGDVVGPYEQAEIITEFCDRVKNEKAEWLSGFTFYQFRDRGRLGLEIEDPNNPDVGIRRVFLPCHHRRKRSTVSRKAPLGQLRGFRRNSDTSAL